MSSPMDVAIIGAGLGGLTLAKTLLLHGQGRVRVTVYEAWSQWKVRGGALGLVAGRQVLTALGLEEDLAKVANDGFEMQYYAQGQHLNSARMPACLAMRSELQQILVRSMPADIVKLGYKLANVVEKDDEVMLSFENGATASAHVVVASDGIHSFVRQKVFGADEPVYTGFRVLYSVSSTPIRPDPRVAHISWSEAAGRGYGVLDLTAGRGEGRHDLCIMISRSEERDNERWDSTIVKDRLKEIAQDVAPEHQVLQKALEHAEVCFDWGIYRQPPVKTWISPKRRVVLLGDAAHATAPFMGQGANMAMHDAYCLGQILANEKLSLSDGLALYEATRKSYCEEVVQKSSHMGELHTASGLKATLRNHLLRFVMLREMQKVMAADPLEKPWEKRPKPSLQRLGQALCKFCC